MLTESEKQWIAWKCRLRRDKDLAGAFCQNCPHLGRHATGCYGEPYCPLFPDWQDALEFSERVAARLAEIDFQPVADTRPSVRLKYARLAVEEEMDADQYFNDIEDKNVRKVLKASLRDHFAVASKKEDSNADLDN